MLAYSKCIIHVQMRWRWRWRWRCDEVTAAGSFLCYELQLFFLTYDVLLNNPAVFVSVPQWTSCFQYS